MEPIGKRCEVWFANQEPGALPTKGVIRHTPSAEGDSWIIECDDGTLHYVQHFEEIIVRPEDQKAGEGE
jgi:hypothetical protein